MPGGCSVASSGGPSEVAFQKRQIEVTWMFRNSSLKYKMTFGTPWLRYSASEWIGRLGHPINVGSYLRTTNLH